MEKKPKNLCVDCRFSLPNECELWWGCKKHVIHQHQNLITGEITVTYDHCFNIRRGQRGGHCPDFQPKE